MPRSISAFMSTKWHVAEVRATQTSSHSSQKRSPTSKWWKRVKRDTTCCTRPSSTAVHSVGLVSPSLPQLLCDNGSSIPSVTRQQFPCSGCEKGVALGMDAALFLCCSERLLAKSRCETSQSINLSEIPMRGTHKTCVAQETGGNTRMRWDTEIERRVLRLRAKEFVKSTDRSHQRRYKLRLAIASQV